MAFAGSLVCANAEAQQEVEVASKAFAEGQQAQLRGEFVRAAELFEIADHAVPSGPALRSAIRNRAAAGQDVRAATLSLQAIQRYPGDADTRGVAEATITQLAPKLTRIRLVCNDPCTVTLDGALVGAGAIAKIEFFAAPGTHVVRASWPGRPQISESIETRAGQSLEIAMTPPREATRPEAPAVPAPPPVRPLSASLPPPPVMTYEPAGGLSPSVFFVGLGLTAVGGGLVYWSGSETLDERDEYERNPTRDAYDDGVKLERRTNLLIGATALVGAATLGIGLFATDWGGSSRVGVRVAPDRVALSMVGELP
jgi:hypothetical protein